jgi:hypothetical protein
MKIHKKVAGRANTLGDLKQFIKRAEDEGFTDDSLLCPDHPNNLTEAIQAAVKAKGVNIFLDEVTGDDSLTEPMPFRGICPECRQTMPIGANKVMPEHYRGDTQHDSARCYGVGKAARSVVTNT